MGETSNGKDSVTNQVVKDLNLNVVKTYTTRKKRTPEEDTHYFVDLNAYNNDKNNERIAAETEINGNKYWSRQEDVLNSDIYIIDPKGVRSLRKTMGNDIVPIYIYIPFEVRKNRAIDRGDNLYDFLERSDDELDQFIRLKSNMEYKYMIYNEDLDKSCKILKSIINAEEI